MEKYGTDNKSERERERERERQTERKREVYGDVGQTIVCLLLFIPSIAMEGMNNNKQQKRIRTRRGESIINTNSKRRHKDESTLIHVDLADFFSCCRFPSLNVNTRLSGSHSPKLNVKKRERQDHQLSQMKFVKFKILYSVDVQNPRSKIMVEGPLVHQHNFFF